ncbi:ABC-2 transporter permease [Peptoniphilus harei]|uniref:ABC-2 transporter permease n=1 Tax=Peptoniphilus harei TaxID=54005 RepID=UPI0025DF0BA9|nr:ABC-2 transporter permease [Peptoniphilus harei]MDU1643493.1 ABC-2 transporter permease [Peptoniphilus harei]MDU3087485.1 ABC-2 transporter permease [Peptoniphilus harei]MDU5417153.1 ABC-2 transporter permease [Peptoniphilus harei]
MKAVLYNDFKLVRNTALPLVIVIGAILALSVVITGEKSEQFFIQWAFIMIFTLRAQVAFGDNFKDFQKFMTMPVSLKDYSLAKIIKNLIVFILTSIVFLIGLIASGDEDRLILNMYINLIIALDFFAFSLSHLIFTKYKKGLVAFLYGLLIVAFALIFGLIYMTNYDILINYRPRFIVSSIIICILSFSLDYKYSTKYLRGRG